MNKITKEDIRVRYNEYNRLYFGNQLKHCKFSVQKMSWCEGMYTYMKEKDGIIEGRIWLTNDIDWTEATLRETIIHEMIHHYVRTIDRQWGGLFGHGRLFRRQCKRLKRDYGLTITIHSTLPRIYNKCKII